ncbi:hypothetical protein TNCV_2315781 [Trichonephila clavipes]|nr:hypothetical protein TNCV_2315781 [Trichonephila clavipes]
MSKKRETKWFLLTNASLMWDSKKTRLSRVDRPLRNPLCRGEMHFSFSKTYTKRVLTMRSKVLQKQIRGSVATLPGLRIEITMASLQLEGKQCSF